MAFDGEVEKVEQNLYYADLLDLAATILEKQGHTKHSLQDHNGSVCFMGAINQARSGNPFDWGCAFYNFGSSESIAACAVVYWNNAPERTAEEVIQCLRDEASRLRSTA